MKNELHITKNQMITLENLLHKFVAMTENDKMQAQFTVPEILEIKQMHKVVVRHNQTPERKES